MAKKVLILCDAFAPPLYVTRVINLCKNLNQEEWEPTIIAEQFPGDDFNTDICKLHLMKYYNEKNKLSLMSKRIMHLLLNHKEKCFEKFIYSTVDIKSFDLILCSVFYLFPLQTAQRISQKHYIPLIIDIRDMTEQWGNQNKFYHPGLHLGYNLNFIKQIIEKRNIKLRNAAIAKADIVTTISPWHRDFLSKINPNTQLIYNGYDTTRFYHQAIKTDTFNINYTGKIYDFNIRNPHLLFQAINELHSEGKITPDTVKINWYIEPEITEELTQLTSKYSINEYNNIFQFVPQEQIPTILNEAAINLILINKVGDGGPYGIMTTKFFEALGVEKPILCISSDEDCLAQTIRYTQSGIATRKVNDVKNLIIEQLEIWKTNGHTHIETKNREIFTRQYQAKQFTELFNSLINKENQRN
ncbi:MAG: hypothetical protein R3Y59_03315 [bacterium]